MAKKITGENFDSVVANSTQPVLVDFWAEWCGPCRQLGPSIEELATEYEGKAVVGKINIDEEVQLAQKYGVRSIPTVALFKNGQVVDTFVGLRPKRFYADILDKA
jgi:thioredoxin 1